MGTGAETRIEAELAYQTLRKIERFRWVELIIKRNFDSLEIESELNIPQRICYKKFLVREYEDSGN